MFSGDTIGKYRLVSRLGRGGMGEVWLATASGHGGFTKTVVVKTLLPELACDPLFIEMLAHEARICAKLSHPNLIEVFDFTEHGGIYLLAMEHVIGRPLHHIMRAARARNWEVPAWFALRVAWECCRGLECAHEQGIIHCDLSPSNIMVTFTGVTKILDFGVAHSSARGPKADRLKGKFPYMAPERIKSLATDRRTDVYALGVMLYLLFTGHLPFEATSDGELLHKIVNFAPPPPSAYGPIEPQIETIILRAMQPDPSARHQTISEVLAALSPCLDGQLGAYGQHDAAEFVNGLFAAPEPAHGPRQLPAVAEVARVVTEDDVTRQPASAYPPPDDFAVELDSFDVEVESSVLEVPREAPVEPRPLLDAFISGARASSSISPLSKPLTAVFAHPAEPHETRTSVQSLFGERPPLTFGHSSVFDRPPSENRDSPTEGRALGSNPGSRPEHRWLEPAAPEPLPEPDDAPHASLTEPPRGVFGGYASSSRAAPQHWPWPSSRTKPE